METGERQDQCVRVGTYMTLSPESRIVITGAGSVGCYLGGCLAAAGRDVSLLMREKLAAAISKSGLRVSDLDGSSKTISSSSLAVFTDPAEALKDADVVLLTVKCRNTEEMAELIAQHAPKDAAVVSLQNGVDNVAIIEKALGQRRSGIVGGMIPFNVVQTMQEREAPSFHRASGGTIQIGAGIEGLRDMLDVDGTRVAEHADIRAVLWAKLLINLNNALNALSGLPLATELGDRRWRLLLVAQIREGLAALRAAGIEAGRLEGMPPRLIAFALRLRDPLFRLAARGMLAVDPQARSSMWEDLRARRPTEIDYIQGKIVRLAERHGVPASLNRRVMQLVKEAERMGQGSPGLSPEAVAGQ
jgi:2-dehydropantoate 2-reductase